MSGPLRSLLRWIAVLAVPTLLLLGVTEIVLRASGAEHVVGRRVTERMYPLSAESEDKDLWGTRMFDPVLGWRLRPGAWLPRRQARINSFGFVGRDFAWTKRPGTKRVLCLGDSVTYGLWACGSGFFCHGTPYPAALELAWNRAGRSRVEAINAGVYGYSSLQGLRYYRAYLGDLDPDVVTAMFGWNDHGQRFNPEGREPRNAVLRALAHGATRLATYRTLAGLLALASMGDPGRAAAPSGANGHVSRVSLDDFAYHLEELVRLARERRTPILFVTEPIGPDAPESAEIPAVFLLPSYEALADLHERYNTRMREVAERLDVPLVDAAADFERRDKSSLFNPWDLVHPNDAGHAAIAQLIAERIARERWLPTATR